MRDIEDYSLLAHNTFGIDARCRRFLEYETEDEAVEVARILREAHQPYLIIGGGSNLLLTRDYEGIVVHSACRGISGVGTENGRGLLCAGSGETWDDVVAESVSRGYYGAENLSLIPGDVGASVVQNIGAYGVEVKEFVAQVRAVRITDGRRVCLEPAGLHYGYRDSRFKHEWKNGYLITDVVYRFQADYRPRLDYGNIRAELNQRGIAMPTAQQLREVIIDIRNAKLPDPKLLGNAGSFFMNPVVPRKQFEGLQSQYPSMPHYYVDEASEKIPAGWLIDQCGWKGRSLGRAGVHDRQALVLVNRGGATGSEIVALCRQIQQDVYARFGIEI